MKTDEARAYIAQQVRDLMEAKGWLQKDLARAAGMTESSLSSKLRDRSFTDVEMWRLAAALDVPITDLFPGTPPGGIPLSPEWNPQDLLVSA